MNPRSVPRILVFIALSLTAVACGSDAVAPPPPAVATTLEKVSGDDQQAAAGAALNADLVVRVRDQKGQTLSGATVSWQVTGGGGSVSAATTITNAQGTASAQWTLGASAGDNSVRATLGASAAPAEFVAKGLVGAAATLTVSPDTATLIVGEAPVQLDAVVRDQHGNALADPAIVWTSEDESLATVSASGLVTGAAEGEVAITARSGDAEGAALMHVMRPPVDCSDVRTFSNGETLSGALPGVLVNGSVTLAGPTTVCGNVEVAGSGRLDLNGHTLTVDGDFTTAGGGRLVMHAATDRLSVGGNAVFDGATGDELSDGVLEIGGNVSMDDGSANSFRFRASGSHQVVLNGASAQSVTFHHTGPLSNRFHHLRIENSVGVTFATSNQINGGLDLVRQATVPGGITLTVAGALTLRTTAVLNNGGTMTVGSCTKEAGHTITGTDPCP